MMGHKICFYGKIWLIIPELSLSSLLIWRAGTCTLTQVWECIKRVLRRHPLGLLYLLEITVHHWTSNISMMYMDKHMVFQLMGKQKSLVTVQTGVWFCFVFMKSQIVAPMGTGFIKLDVTFFTIIFLLF